MDYSTSGVDFEITNRKNEMEKQNLNLMQMNKIINKDFLIKYRLYSHYQRTWRVF